MNPTRIIGATKSAGQLATQVRYASHASPISAQMPRHNPEHGHNIYVFCHMRTNQIVYSLNKVVKNNAALAQLPYNGKKTVPRALRKDLWFPFATINFPQTPDVSRQGLMAFHKLREYRKLHETQWDHQDLMQRAREKADKVVYSRAELDKKNKQEKKAIEKKRKKALGWLLCDQKANSVADMAAVLAKLDFNPPVEKVVEKKAEKKFENDDAAAARSGDTATEAKETDSKKSKKADAVSFPAKRRVAPNSAPIIIQWRDILDAEFAASWPLGVLHDYFDPGVAPRAKYVDGIEQAGEEGEWEDVKDY